MSTGLYPVGLVGVGLQGVYTPGVADTTTPVLTAPPTVSAIGATGATGHVTTDDGSGYLFVLVSSSPSATDATVYATGGVKAVSAEGAQAITLTGLAPETAYYLYVGQKDSALNEAAVVRSEMFTTTAAGDTTAPVLTLPTGTNTGPFSAIGSVTTDTADGTLYYLTTTSPTAAAGTVKAASTQAVTASGLQNISITGLNESTGYYNHFLHRDAAGNDSAVSSSAQWLTESAAPAVGSINLGSPLSHVLKNNTGTPFASAAFRCTIIVAATGALIGVKTGTTTAGALVGVLTDAALVAGTDYFVIVEPGGAGAYGVYRATAT